jgi:hypothetical protein
MKTDDTVHEAKGRALSTCKDQTTHYTAVRCQKESRISGCVNHRHSSYRR